METMAVKKRRSEMPSALTSVKKFFPRVKSIADSTKNIKIEVTKNDANSKAVKQHDACAFAVACKRKFHLSGVIISRSVAYLIKRDKAYRFQLPPSIEREIVSFDRGAGFAVGEYELERVSKSDRLGIRVGRKQLEKNRLNKTKRYRHITTNIRTVLGGQKPEEEKK